MGVVAVIGVCHGYIKSIGCPRTYVLGNRAGALLPEAPEDLGLPVPLPDELWGVHRAKNDAHGLYGLDCPA